MVDKNSASVIALFPFECLYLIFYAIFIHFRDLFRIVFPIPPKSLRGEVILVTGGANGIGRGICREISKQEKNLSIIIWDVNEKANSETVTELQDAGVRNVFAYKVDVSDKEQVRIAAEKVRKEIGDVTMLFNNAGIGGNGPAGWKEDKIIFEKVFGVNMLSHIWTLKEFLPRMLEKGRGHVVATSSVVGFLPSSGAAYGASKFAVRGFMEGVKEDVRNLPGKPNINFSTVYPGLTATDMTAGLNLLMTRYKFLNIVNTPDYVAQNIIEGVRRGQEHIYVPGLFRLVRFVFELLPAECGRKFYDLAGAPHE